MTLADPSQLSSFSPWSKLLKPSHRTRPEQVVGFGIFFSICLGMEWLNGWLVQFSFSHPWFQNFLKTRWIFPDQVYILIATACFWFWSFAIWSLWRRNSLRILKLEVSLFFSQFVFLIFWTISLFVFQEMLVALVAIVLLWFNILLAALLFWKKERFSGQLLLFPFVWIFYAMGLNMVICISNS